MQVILDNVLCASIEDEPRFVGQFVLKWHIENLSTGDLLKYLITVCILSCLLLRIEYIII